MDTLYAGIGENDRERKRKRENDRVTNWESNKVIAFQRYYRKYLSLT